MLKEGSTQRRILRGFTLLPLLLFQSGGRTFCRTGSVCLTTAGSGAQGRISTV